MAYPSKLPAKYRRFWDRPWEPAARRSVGFRRWLRDNGYLTPHFRTVEAHSKDGVKVPRRYSYRCRQHAFLLEVLRHELGDVPLPVLSWYRSPARNAAVGGAKASRHMKADATDFDRSVVSRVGRDRFFRAAEKVFKDGGVGNYPGGSAHVDSRGWRARWRSF